MPRKNFKVRGSAPISFPHGPGHATSRESASAGSSTIEPLNSSAGQEARDIRGAGKLSGRAGPPVQPPSGAPSGRALPQILAPTSPRDLLLTYQRRWSDDTARWKIGCWSRQTGKDFSSGEEGVRDCFAHEMADPPSKTTWLIGAPSERQSIESFEKWKEWAESYKLAIADIAEEREGGSETLLRSSTLTFPGGSRIIAVPGNPDTIRGFSANLLLTEFAFFEDPDRTWRAALPSITNPLRGGLKKVRLISTPNGAGNKFHDLWTKNYQVKDSQWSCHKITIYDAVAQGLPVNVDELRAAIDDPEGWAQEFECEFLDTSAVLLPYDLIALGESAEAMEITDDLFWQSRGNPVYCGIDFGRSNDPTVCWTLERIGGLLWTREVLVLRNTETPEQVGILRRRIARATRASVDYTGPGIGFGDYLKKEFGLFDPQAHEFGKVELCTFTTGFKRELFPKLRRAFVAPTTVRIPISRLIREDLHAMQQVVTNGEYNYWAPRTKDGHSDRCTALALAVHAAGTGSAGVLTSVAGIHTGHPGRNLPTFKPRWHLA